MHNETIQDRWPTAKAIPNNSQSLFGFESCQSSRTCRPTWNSLKPLSSHYPTPAVWRSGRTLLTICGPCLSPSTLRRAQGSGRAPRVGAPSRVLRRSNLMWSDWASVHTASRRARPLLGPFPSTQRLRSSRHAKRKLRPSGRAKQQARLPGRKPASTVKLNKVTFMLLSHTQATFL